MSSRCLPVWLAGLALTVCAQVAHADAVASLQSFVKDVQAGRTSFVQTVTSPDGKKSRQSKGTLEFLRPNRFRFTYTTPTEQLIVGDGRQVWLYDADLNQVTVRSMSQALGATPAAILAGGNLDKDFTLKNVPASPSGAATATPMPSQATNQIEWVEAVPRHKEGTFQSMKLGFKAGQLASLEILDGFGQRSRLDFTPLETKPAPTVSRFQFTPPAGADVLTQP